DIRLPRGDGSGEVDEFLKVDIRGKGFVYNQIRLMMGAAIAEARGDMPPETVLAALHGPQKIRVPLAPAEGLVLESQAFTRNKNAFVLDPRELSDLGGTMVKWGSTREEGNKMQTTGRLQSLLTGEQLEEALRWRQEHILPAMARVWERTDAVGFFLRTVTKYFVGQQEEALQAAREHLGAMKTKQKEAEDKANCRREQAFKAGSSSYKDLLPRKFSTNLVCHTRLLPGNKVSAIQIGLVKRIKEGDVPVMANTGEILAFVDKVGIDVLAA
ncbi:unnamed protein product, partial [Discosporangium mesarthrocarpum]